MTRVCSEHGFEVRVDSMFSIAPKECGLISQKTKTKKRICFGGDVGWLGARAEYGGPVRCVVVGGMGSRDECVNSISSSTHSQPFE